MNSTQITRSIGSTSSVTKESLALAGLAPVLVRGGLHDDGTFTTKKTKFSVLAVDCFNNICCTILSDVSFEEGADKVSELSSENYEEVERQQISDLERAYELAVQLEQFIPRNNELGRKMVGELVGILADVADSESQEIED